MYIVYHFKRTICLAPIPHLLSWLGSLSLSILDLLILSRAAQKIISLEEREKRKKKKSKGAAEVLELLLPKLSGGVPSKRMHFTEYHCIQ